MISFIYCVIALSSFWISYSKSRILELGVATKNWHLLSAATKMKSPAIAVTDLQHTLKGVQGWRSAMRHPVPWRQMGRRSLQIVRYFQEKVLWGQFLSLLISRRAIKSLMMTYAPCDQQQISARMCVWVHIHLSRVSYLIPLSLPLWNNCQNYLKCCLLGYNLHFAPNIILMLCFFFFHYRTYISAG